MAAAKKTPAKAPTTVTIEYFFCDNVNCNNHASFVVGTRPATSGLQAGGTCPQCHVGKITEVDLTQAANAPLVPSAIGVVLPALPYGGLPLRLGDDDTQNLWGGQIVNDPHHQGAHYVGELQRDLLRLAFYGPARGNEHFGKFSNHLMGSVLDFKHHLTTFFGIDTSEDLAEVEADAAAADKAERAQAAGATPASVPAGAGAASGGAASAPTAAPASTPTSSLRIFFPKNGLANPAEVYSPVQGWVAALGFPPGGVGNVQKTFETWAKSWENTNEPFLKGKAAKQKDLEARDARANLITGALDSTKTQAESATAAAAFLNAAPTAGKPDQAFVQQRRTALSNTSGWTQTAAPATPAVPATPQTPALPAKPAVSDGTIPKLLLRMATLEARWAALNPPLSPPPEWDDVKQGLANLSDALVAYHDEINKSQATTLMSAYLLLIQKFGQVDPGTARFIRRMAMDGALNGTPIFRIPMGLPKGATGPTELADFSSKDPTALKREINFVVAKINQELVRSKSLTLLNTAPSDIIDFIFTHESGGVHSATYGDRRFVKMGIDWNNSGDRSNFSPSNTSGKQPSSSRGWGVSQKTFFDRPETLVLSDNSSGTPQPSAAGLVPVTMHAGIPYAKLGDPAAAPPIPIGIASGVETARLGIGIYVRDFLGATQKQQDCTFKTPYDCKNCVKNLTLGSKKLDDKGKKINQGGMTFFNEEEGDFERVIVGKDLISHRFRDLARVKALVATGNYAIKGKTVAQLAEGDTLEFPCSWLTAITRYAGKGEIAWYYALNGISFLQTGNLP